MFLGRLLDKEKSAFYALAHAVAAAEGGVSEAEESILSAAVGEMSITKPSSILSLEEACRSFDRSEGKRIALLELMMVAMIDGSISDEELEKIRSIADHLGIGSQVDQARQWAAAVLTAFRSGERFIARAV